MTQTPRGSQTQATRLASRGFAAMRWRDPLDGVDSATTVPADKALVDMAAQHAVHVICQKPFASNMTDAAAMVQAAETTGKTLMVHENLRWQSAARHGTFSPIR